MNARICWDQAGPDAKHDTAIILFDWRHGHEPPVDALNEVLARFYSQDLHPFFYLAWTDDVPAGLLVTEAMDLTNDEIQALFNRVRELADQIKQGGEFATHEVPV